MKVVNVILSILILILAVASAVFSFLLYEKRAQLLTGWEKMAAAVNQTALEMDKGSGTKVGAELTPEALNHKNFAELDSRLPKLAEQARQLITERDMLADAVRRIGSIIELSPLGTEEQFRELVSAKTNTDDVVAGVTAFRNRRDQLVKAVEATAKRAGLTLDGAALRNGDVNRAFKPFDDKIASILAQFQGYQTTLKAIAVVVGAPVPNFDEQHFSESLKQISDAVNGLKNKLNETTRQLQEATRKIASLEQTVRSKDEEIGRKNEEAKKLNAQINQLKVLLGLKVEDVIPELWAPGSPEARQAVVGKVIEVNRKFGFVAIDLGSNTVVEQAFGNKTAKINPKIENGMLMRVARNQDEYVATIRLTNVSGDCSIGEPLPDGKSIEVGDTVFVAPAEEAPAAQ